MAKRKAPYRSKVKIGIDADGKPINKWIQSSTRAELAAERQKVLAYYVTGAALNTDRSFGEYATEWYRVRKAPNASASSQEAYRTALNKDLLPILGDRQLRAITAMELQEILNSYKGMSNTKITVIIATLHGIFGSAVADRLISVDPSAHLTRPSAAPSKITPAFTPEQRAALERVCRTHPAGHYLGLMYYLGCRPGEARGLRWEDIDWAANRVRIERDIDYKAGATPGDLKTKASRRTVPLPAALRRILEPLRGLPNTYIAHGEQGAGKPLAKSSAERLWVSLMVDAGMAVESEPNKYRSSDPRAQYTPLYTPHSLRHNYITMCWEAGLDPYQTMRLVGHVSITTTINIYTSLSNAQMDRTAAQLEEMFSGAKVAEKLHDASSTWKSQK